MHDFELDQMRRNPAWGVTLKRYWQTQQTLKTERKEFDGWVPRLSLIEGVEPAKLSNVHGRLIAFGFLRFDLSDRELGMRYQLTPLGRQAIGAGEAEELAELAESA
jgi:hypothetical protein